MQWESARASDEPLPGAIRDAVAAAVEGGATMDEIVARVRAGDDDCPGSADGRWAARMDGLVGLQREADRSAGEWARDREPGAEGRSALVAIETLRTLTLRTMADLSQRAEPVATEELARLALALNRIERADRLRIERERAAAEAGADPEVPAGRAARMTHAERVETVRRAVEGHFFPHRRDPPPASEWDPAACADDPLTWPDPAPAPPADGGAPVESSRAQADDDDAWDARRAPDEWDARRARDAWNARGARDAHLSRREAEGQLWPTDPPFCPAEWSGPG